MSVYVTRSPYYSGGAVRGGASKRFGFGGVKKRSVVRKVRRRGGLVALRAAGVGARRAADSVRKGGADAFVGTARMFSDAARVAARLPNKKSGFEIGSGLIVSGLVGLSIFLSLAYLMHFNHVATKGYDLKRLEAARQQLLNQYEIKNMQLAEVQSLTSIMESAKADAMRRPYSVSYVRGNIAIASR